jgi:hypothetical protein
MDPKKIIEDVINRLLTDYKQVAMGTQESCMIAATITEQAAILADIQIREKYMEKDLKQ